GAVRDRLGLQVTGEGQNALVEQLSGVKTLRGIVEVLEALLRGDAHASNGAVAAAVPEPPAATASRVERYVVGVDAVPPPTPAGVGGAERTFAITRDEHGVAQHLAGILERHGARARVLEAGEALGAVDGLIHLATLVTASSGAVRELFTLAREAA